MIFVRKLAFRAPVRSFVSILGIAFAVAVLFVGLAFIDVMNLLINEQFDLSMRQDATIAFVDPRSTGAIYVIQHLPGVMHVEPQRSTPVRLRRGARSRTLAIAGVPATPRLNRVVDRSGRAMELTGDGLVLSRMLGDLLAVAPG